MKRIIILCMVSVFSLACQTTSVDKKNDVIKYKQTVTLNDVPKAMLTFLKFLTADAQKGYNVYGQEMLLWIWP
ncbi:hypothetical protein [Dyadobacter sp. NIV53]|uniref:hypothetical protein n=1 Tax=Dyadobacter sp. NIV53 TaxID=2861765 RepID=UPI001C87660D|nr:hypothetical protein [Dyadobacter sp. NIV53]